MDKYVVKTKRMASTAKITTDNSNRMIQSSILNLKVFLSVKLWANMSDNTRFYLLSTRQLGFP